MNMLKDFIKFFTTKIGKAIIMVALSIVMLCIFITIISTKQNTILKQQNELLKQKEEILKLEFHNETLKKEIDFIKESEKLKINFKTSTTLIQEDKKLQNINLDEKEYEILNQINYEFYNYFTNTSFLQDTNKIYKNAFIKTTKPILFRKYNKQTRLNERISKKYYQDKRMAIMVQYTARNKLL